MQHDYAYHGLPLLLMQEEVQEELKPLLDDLKAEQETIQQLWQKLAHVRSFLQPADCP